MSAEITTAVLIDGGFFLKRLPHVFPDASVDDPKAVAFLIQNTALSHLKLHDGARANLYRTFFYDCPPITKKMHRPVSKRSIDFSKTDAARFRIALHAELRRCRKMALRLGHLAENQKWRLKDEALSDLLKGLRSWTDIVDEDFQLDVDQKGVDMRIGVDISWLAHKQLVNQIVLVAGDADFVPAAKVARREGIDFILDPLWNHIHPNLHEHIDGLRSWCPNPVKSRSLARDNVPA